MTAHVSVRLAWHDDGWNGHVCRNPAANTFCVGNYSFPGQLIAENRDTEVEKSCAGTPCPLITESGGSHISIYIPPCCHSTNAFGRSQMTAYADPPDFFGVGPKRRYWNMPAATSCTWPYEEMYKDAVKQGAGHDNVKRREDAKRFFQALEPDRSLLIHYANYSNPFSEDERMHYVLVGISRLKTVGGELLYEGCSDEVKKRYGGGFVWQRALTSHYPEQGIRIPYHLYRDRPDDMARILVVPENPRLCKYACRLLTDDDTLGLIEQVLTVAFALREMKDTSDNWNERIRWLQSLVAELWQHRGLYPGMPAMLDSVGFHEAIPYFKEQVLAGKEELAADAILAFLDGKSVSIKGIRLDKVEAQKVTRQWKLRDPECRRLLHDVIPRIELDVQQIDNLVDAQKRSEHCVLSSLQDIADNPYILAEEYVGDNPDDSIPWSVVDRGMIPSPDLGGGALAEKDDGRRLRGLAVDVLKHNDTHVFLAAGQLLQMINAHLDHLPDWKKHHFSMQYFDLPPLYVPHSMLVPQHPLAACGA